jgi:hypothetical protein
VALKDRIEAAVNLVQAGVEVGNGALLRFETIGNASVAGAKNRHEARSWLILQGFLPFPGVFVGLRLVIGDVALVDLVVEVVFKDAVRVGGIPFLSHELHLLKDRLLVCMVLALRYRRATLRENIRGVSIPGCHSELESWAWD